MSSNDPIVSTGRGGAGNIGHDPHVYTDGAIVREGVQGESSEPEYSTGRGGAGNISTPRHGTPDPHAHVHHPAADPSSAGRRSTDVIPEPALRQPGPDYANYHTGRGGEGNIHREKYGGHSGPQKEDKEKHHHHDEKEGEGEGGKKGLGEKVKHLLHIDGHARKSGESSREGTPGA
ncbi:uncharacterized protein J3D65DRAFT_615085 [Phyllosticta citribraziliensis]|uniref:Dehydrin n=1 Tax=Phyllosticta citribraziliensis TaxID=989973 RepID=A0ABR1M733_9PEZI